MRRVQRGLPLLAAAGLLALATTWRPAIAPISPPDRSAFPIADVARGAVLAKLGDCAVCHTAQGGTPLAGGRALATLFGPLYSKNITPDPATGIGRWSLVAFARAMHDGVRRAGAHLYPALPYEHFTHITDADLASLYAFPMTRHPVVAEAPAKTINRLYKAEVIHRGGPWRSFKAVEYATLEWVDWFNNRRLLEPIGNIPPVEAEQRHHAMLDDVPPAA